MKKVVISGTISLQKEINHWTKRFETRNYQVIDSPAGYIPQKKFIQEYPKVYTQFFRNIVRTDILFIMNENKNEIQGYIGAETFAELIFGVVQNHLHKQNIEIILLKMPSEQVQSFDKIILWLKLGWIKLLKDTVLNLNLQIAKNKPPKSQITKLPSTLRKFF